MGSDLLRKCVRDVTPYLFFLITITTMGPLLFGFHLAELNAPQDVITCKKQSANEADLISNWGLLSALPQCIKMDDAEFGLVSSIFTLGGLVGALFGGPLSTSKGRLLSMQIATIFAIVGAAIEALAPSIFVFASGRLLAGVGAGCSLVVVPLYIAEVAPPHERGVFGVMTQITINFGLLIAQGLGYFFSHGSMWRIILAAASVIGILQLIGLFFIPESPMWSAANRDPHIAMQILQRIRGRHSNIEEEFSTWDISADADASSETQSLLSDPELIAGLQATASNTTKRPNVGFFEVVRDPFYRPAIIAVIGVFLAQQLTGINSVMMYSVSLLDGLFPTSSVLITIAITCMNNVVTILCAPLPDMLGRKKTLLLSICGMGLSSIGIALSISFAFKIFSAVSVLLFVSFFAVGLGPIPFILASELVGQEAKGATQSWALGASWIATFCVAQFFPIINAALGGKGLAYFMFAGLATFFALFVTFLVPESRGRKDADEVWGRVKRVD